MKTPHSRSGHVGALAVILTVLTAPIASAHVSDSAAEALVRSLTPQQADAIRLDFDSDERRDWHYIPRGRRGLALKDMTAAQKQLAMNLLHTVLSDSGYSKAVGVMRLEDILGQLEGRPEHRDGERYYFSVFGHPGVAPWGFRFEGHHVSLNFTIATDTLMANTPAFFGANPARVPHGPHAGERLLPAEEDLARALVTSLDDTQRAIAVIMSRPPRDIFNIPGRNATKPEGIGWNDLNAEQRTLLRKLVLEYIGNMRPEHAARDLERLESAGLDTLHFAWAGSMESGKPHYYRIQAGSFVLEYDNIQNNANHIHSVWRDFDRDFGADLLGEHYRSEH